MLAGIRRRAVQIKAIKKNDLPSPAREVAAQAKLFRHLNGSKSSFIIALICADAGQNPAACATNQDNSKKKRLPPSEVVARAQLSLKLNGSKSSISIALICTARRRILADASTN